MARRRRAGAAERLQTRMNGIPVGHLTRETSGAISFQYLPEWLAREQAIPISRQIPLRESPFVGATVLRYFDNLLPDDRRIRESIAARVGSAVQAFDLLGKIGQDCVGALQFCAEDAPPAPLATAQGEPYSEPQIASMLRDLQINPLGLSLEQDFRISLAGAQSKTALLKMDGQWRRPHGATPTTHIIKPAIGPLPNGPDLSLSAENEWLCLRLLHAFGLEAAQAEVVSFEDIRALVVQRFDREWSQDRLFRWPQEDFCQALGIGPETKYETHGGPGIKDILPFLNESSHRDEDRRAFMKAQILFWMLGAIDGHAKNFSVFIRPIGFFMTPLYDVMSADPLINPRTLPLQKVKLAMAVGENRHYLLSRIQPRHFLQSAKLHKFAGMEELMAEVKQATEEAITSVSRQLPDDFPGTVSDPIFQALRRRAALL